jgi:Asp-tRNA(Asn)/Glu-tRNA(Gln) amidotransferase A subunit family amidase
MEEIEIDFEALKYADFEVVNGPTNPEVDKAFSAFLKELRAKEARLAETEMPRTKKPLPLPSTRKNVRAATK